MLLIKIEQMIVFFVSSYTFYNNFHYCKNDYRNIFFSKSGQNITRSYKGSGATIAPDPPLEKYF